MIKYEVISPCAYRQGDTVKARYKNGDEAELPKREADRLLAAGCICKIETATQKTRTENRKRKTT